MYRRLYVLGTNAKSFCWSFIIDTKSSKLFTLNSFFFSENIWYKGITISPWILLFILHLHVIKLSSEIIHSSSRCQIKKMLYLLLTIIIFGIQFTVDTFVSSFDHLVLSDYNEADRNKKDINHYVNVKQKHCSRQFHHIKFNIIIIIVIYSHREPKVHNILEASIRLVCVKFLQQQQNLRIQSPLDGIYNSNANYDICNFYWLFAIFKENSNMCLTLCTRKKLYISNTE
jgi:hypothetical protein